MRKVVALAAIAILGTSQAIATETSVVRTMRDAVRYCERNPDARENGIDEKLISIHACAVRVLGAANNTPSSTGADIGKLSCGDITGEGWNHMPDVTDYFLAQPGADKLGYGSPCAINSLVFSQCWLEPRWSVAKAINILLHKAATGKKLPDIPMCGA